jgi:hypothetical protein
VLGAPGGSHPCRSAAVPSRVSRCHGDPWAGRLTRIDARRSDTAPMSAASNRPRLRSRCSVAVAPGHGRVASWCRSGADPALCCCIVDTQRPRCPTYGDRRGCEATHDRSFPPRRRSTDTCHRLGRERRGDLVIDASDTARGRNGSAAPPMARRAQAARNGRVGPTRATTRPCQPT